MIYLISSIMASVAVSVLLKIAKKYKISIAQAVAFNYPTAICMSFLFLKPNLSDFHGDGNWHLFILLGILLPSVFIVMGKATQKAGIVKADAAQRLSLVFTLSIAFFLWNETASAQKIMGIILACLALILLLNKNSKHVTYTKNAYWILLIVWFGYGCIDLIFKLISKTNETNFGTNLTISFMIATVLIFVYLLIRRSKFSLPSIVGGLFLGILNFINIFTYIRAHQIMSENPSVVFTGMNIGVIALGALIGLFVFKEKLNPYNYVGLGLAVLAIILLFTKL